MSEPAAPAPKPAASAPRVPPAAHPAADAAARAARPADAVPSTDAPLTPDEQMERFANELKETDWGHQPC